MDYQDIPWYMSDIKPRELKTSAHMSPRESEIARRDALALGAAWKRDRCQCGERYSVLNPNCANWREHQEVAGRLEAEKELEAVMA